MGVLTDFVVADRSDSRRVCDSRNPSREFGGLDGKGVDTVKLGQLHAVLTGSGYDPSFISDSLCDGGEEGPWVFEVPPDLVQRLARLTPRQLTNAGLKWAATEEFSPRYDNWPVERVQHMLASLATLCNRATTEGKAVLMWMCL